MSELPLNLITLEAEIHPAWLKGRDGRDGRDGKSPRINDSGNWETYDSATDTWTDTGVNASGGMSYELATEADIDAIFDEVFPQEG